MARSFYRLMGVDTGISAGRVLTMHVQFSDLVCTFKNTDWAAQEKKCWMGAQDVLNGIRRTPGVQRAALSMGGPFSGGLMTAHHPGSGRTGVFVDDLEDDQLPAGQLVLGIPVTPGYLMPSIKYSWVSELKVIFTESSQS